MFTLGSGISNSVQYLLDPDFRGNSRFWNPKEVYGNMSHESRVKACNYSVTFEIGKPYGSLDRYLVRARPRFQKVLGPEYETAGWGGTDPVVEMSCA